MSRLSLVELRCLYAAASQGKWSAFKTGVLIGPKWIVVNDPDPAGHIMSKEDAAVITLMHREVPAMIEELEEARRKARVITCVYCGHEYEQGTTKSVQCPEAKPGDTLCFCDGPTCAASGTVLTEHIKVCAKHPLRAAENQIALLKLEVEAVGTVLLEVQQDCIKANEGSEARLKVLLEKDEECKREWKRAEVAEGQVRRLTRELDEAKRPRIQSQIPGPAAPPSACDENHNIGGA